MERKKLQWCKKAGVACLLLAATAVGSPAQTFRSLVSFNGSDGAHPTGSLVQDKHGNIYGTTYGGGAYDYGTVFKVTPKGTLTTLYSFCSQSGCSDGAYPYAGLVPGTDGNFYGTTYGGGASDDGTVFEITREGTLTTLYSFDGTEGVNPVAPLIEATDGKFYGTTWLGGANGYGTVFEITREGRLTTLHSFDGTDGEAPYGGLVPGVDGKFYGTTGYGGAYSYGLVRGEPIGYGTVFEITREGRLTTLHSFDVTDGENPIGGLVLGADGKFYGTTSAGGAYICPPYGCGTVFKITRSGTLTTLHSFDVTDGAYLPGGLILGADGKFYGTTYTGGAYVYYGTVFEITREGTLTTLHSFDYTDGGYPNAGLVLGADGKFYGTTYSGGAYCSPNGCGTVFSLTVGRVEWRDE